MKIKLLAFLSFITILASCAEQSLDNRTALQTIEAHLKQHPIYETTQFTPGKVKLRQSKDSDLIAAYTHLNEQGYVQFDQETQRKKWLSKDSIWEATISLTPKARPYIVDQKKNRVTLQTYIYTTTESSHLKIDSKGKKSALVSVMLHKQPTVFSELKKDKNPHLDMKSKQFKLKLAKTNLYEVVR